MIDGNTTLFTALEIPDCYVVSFGGVGSKLLLKGLFPGQPPKVLKTRHHHWRWPPEAMDAESQVIYLFGDPRNSVVSFFNRRKTQHAGHGFREKERPGQPDWARRHCRNVAGDWRELSADWDLPAFLAHRRDLFRLEEHFDNWLNAAWPPRILHVRFESLWSNLPTVFEFLDLPTARAADFPPCQARASDWRDQPEAERAGLDEVYGAFSRRLEALPNVFERGDVSR